MSARSYIYLRLVISVDTESLREAALQVGGLGAELGTVASVETLGPEALKSVQDADLETAFAGLVTARAQFLDRGQASLASLGRLLGLIGPAYQQAEGSLRSAGAR